MQEQPDESNHSSENPMDLEATGQETKERASESFKDIRAGAIRKKEELMHAVDEHKGSFADRLSKMAGKARERAMTLPEGDTRIRAANYAAEKTERTADYIRAHNSSEMMSDFKNTIRRKPLPAMLGAVIAGFLVGRSFRSRVDQRRGFLERRRGGFFAR